MKLSLYKKVDSYHLISKLGHTNFTKIYLLTLILILKINRIRINLAQNTKFTEKGWNRPKYLIGTVFIILVLVGLFNFYFFGVGGGLVMGIGYNCKLTIFCWERKRKGKKKIKKLVYIDEGWWCRTCNATSRRGRFGSSVAESHSRVEWRLVWLSQTKLFCCKFDQELDLDKVIMVVVVNMNLGL